jgi:hypothetical protein
MASSKHSSTVLLKQRVEEEESIQVLFEDQIGQVIYFGVSNEVQPPLIFAKVRCWSSTNTKNQTGVYKSLHGIAMEVFVDVGCLISPVLQLKYKSQIWVSPTKKISFVEQ